MAARITYSVAFVRRRAAVSRQSQLDNIQQPSLQSLLLTSRTLALFGSAALAATASNAVLLGGAGQLSSRCQPFGGSFARAAALHVAVGAVSLGACVAGVLRTERGLVRGLQAARKGHVD